MKTALWLYLFMFVAFFDLHAQYPILSPFAISIGAAPSFIGLIMGVYSLTHLPGNLLAGYGVDRFGSKRFIVGSLIAAGFALLYQSRVTDPWQLLWIRSISGFVLAFLSPACLALLAKLATNPVQQSKFMAGNGFVHTLASVVSPAVGALLVAKLGFSQSFTLLGWGLVLTGGLALISLKEQPLLVGNTQLEQSLKNEHPEQSIPWLFFGIPLSISCSQGILFFELPLMKSTQGSILTSGLMFSLISLGALTTISMLFLNRIPAFLRTLFGSLSLALVFFGISVDWPMPLSVSLILIGMSKGVIFPAIASLLAQVTGSNRYGRVFSLLSISFSIGAFIGPILAGQLRSEVSPYFIAFLILMMGLSILPYNQLRRIALA
jgi:MFS family permease